MNYEEFMNLPWSEIGFLLTIALIYIVAIVAYKAGHYDGYMEGCKHQRKAERSARRMLRR